MKKYFLLVLATVLALSVVFMGGHSSQAATKEAKILEFDSMVGVHQAFTGT